MDERVEVVQNQVSLWQAYKQGLGLGLGILTVYALALILLGLLASRALSSSGSGGEAPKTDNGGKACSTSWV